MQSQINYDNLEANRELIQLSIRFARLSDRKKEVLRILAEKDYRTNKELAEAMIDCSHNTASSILGVLRDEAWLESEAYGRNAYWFFVDNCVKTFIQWELKKVMSSCQYLGDPVN